MSSIASFFVKKAKKPDFNIKAGETFHEGHASIYASGKKSTFKTLINSRKLVIGAHERSMKDPDKVFRDLETLRDNGGMCYFANSDTKGARRGPTACAPPLDLPDALAKLKKDAPSLSKFVDDIATAYKDKGGKSLRGLWWTYYRKDLKKSETIWVPIGMMKPHGDRLGGSTDRVIATFGFNPKGKQKLMSFQYGNDEKTTVWIKITHGMFVCLSEESSGHKVFSYNNKKVKHGVKNAEGTWTVTLEFGPDKRSQQWKIPLQHHGREIQKKNPNIKLVLHRNAGHMAYCDEGGVLSWKALMGKGQSADRNDVVKAEALHIIKEKAMKATISGSAAGKASGVMAKAKKEWKSAKAELKELGEDAQKKGNAMAGAAKFTSMFKL